MVGAVIPGRDNSQASDTCARVTPKRSLTRPTASIWRQQTDRLSVHKSDRRAEKRLVTATRSDHWLMRLDFAWRAFNQRRSTPRSQGEERNEMSAKLTDITNDFDDAVISAGQNM